MSALIGLFALFAPQATQFPLVVPFTVPKQDLAVQAEVGGKSRTLLLGTYSAGSSVREAPASRTDLTFGGRPFAQLTLQEATAPDPGSDGTIATDVLRHTAVGLDLIAGEASLWAGGNLRPEDAEAWVRAAPEWGGPAKVRRIAAHILPYGGLAIDCVVGGKRVPLGLRLALNGSTFEPEIDRPDLPLDPLVSLLPSLSIGGLTPVPATYLAGPKGSVDRRFFGAAGTVSLDQFEARRILVDFASGTVYAEELTPDARLSLLLRRMAHAPIALVGDRLVLREILSDRPQYPALARFMGASVVRLAEEPADSWLRDLRSGDPKAASRTAERFRRVSGAYDLTLRTADGAEVPVHVTALP